MNKEIIAILGVGVAVLVAIWMTWRDVTFQLTDMNARLGRVEGVLIAQGNLDSQAALEPESAETMQRGTKDASASLRGETR